MPERHFGDDFARCSQSVICLPREIQLDIESDDVDWNLKQPISEGLFFTNHCLNRGYKKFSFLLWLTHTINSLHDWLSLLRKEGKIRLSCRAYKTQIPVMFKAKPVGQKLWLPFASFYLSHPPFLASLLGKYKLNEQMVLAQKRQQIVIISFASGTWIRNNTEI